MKKVFKEAEVSIVNLECEHILLATSGDEGEGGTGGYVENTRRKNKPSFETPQQALDF